MNKKILTISTNISQYANSMTKTGLWLGELAHFLGVASKYGFEVDIASPKGGQIPIDPVSLNWLNFDSISRRYFYDKDFMKRLKESISIKELSLDNYSAVYLTGGHGTMYDFPDDENLQRIIGEMYEKGDVVSAVCHGSCGLLNVKLSNGDYLLKDKKSTGYSWIEEILAGRKNIVPFNLEKEIKKRGSQYEKFLIPFMSHTRSDKNLITGQNPASVRAVAEKVFAKLI